MKRLTRIAELLWELLFGCWHTNLGWPHNYSGKLGQRCLECGKLLACKVELERKVA